jgi:hypothetical protein
MMNVKLVWNASFLQSKHLYINNLEIENGIWKKTQENLETIFMFIPSIGEKIVTKVESTYLKIDNTLLLILSHNDVTIASIFMIFDDWDLLVRVGKFGDNGVFQQFMYQDIELASTNTVEWGIEDYPTRLFEECMS